MSEVKPTQLVLTYDFKRAESMPQPGPERKYAAWIPVRMNQKFSGGWHYDVRKCMENQHECFITSVIMKGEDMLVLFCSPSDITQEFLDDQKKRFIEIVNPFVETEYRVRAERAAAEILLSGLSKKFTP